MAAAGSALSAEEDLGFATLALHSEGIPESHEDDTHFSPSVQAPLHTERGKSPSSKSIFEHTPSSTFSRSTSLHNINYDTISDSRHPQRQDFEDHPLNSALNYDSEPGVIALQTEVTNDSQTSQLLQAKSANAQASTLNINSGVIKSVKKTQFPIRVFEGPPPAFSLEAQKTKMRWRYRVSSDLEPRCIVEPDTELIRETVRPFLEIIAPGSRNLSVTFLAEGAFNKAYTISMVDDAAGVRKEYAFRVALPVYPYYKVESDVATTEYVRHSTNIPVPVIYAFDSCLKNELGFEWILMEKIEGQPLHEIWLGMDYHAKEVITKEVADWTSQLTKSAFSQIGSIYMSYEENYIRFFIGPPMHCLLCEGDRLTREGVHRGPFDSLQAFYDAVLDLTEQHVNDPIQRDHLPLSQARLDEYLGMNGPVPYTIDTQTSACPMCSSKYKAPEDPVQAQADIDDHENQIDAGVGPVAMRFLPQELEVYRMALPVLCPLPPESQPMSTVLSHPDLSLSNIFVDVAGKTIALIDWERARIEPPILIEGYPPFLEGWDAFYEGPDNDVVTAKKGAEVFKYADLRRMKHRDLNTYLQIMRRIDNTGLRAVYRQELERLGSPVRYALDPDPESLECQLLERVFYPADVQGLPALQWVTRHVGESWFNDTDDEDDKQA